MCLTSFFISSSLLFHHHQYVKLYIIHAVIFYFLHFFPSKYCLKNMQNVNFFCLRFTKLIHFSINLIFFMWCVFVCVRLHVVKDNNQFRPCLIN